MTREDIIYLLIMIIIITTRKLIFCLEGCKSEVTVDNGFSLHWTQQEITGGLIVSSPICLNSSFEPIKRKCLENGQWEDSANIEKCSHYTLSKVYECPMALTQLRASSGKSLCVSLTENPTEWTNKCANLGSTKSLIHLSSDMLKSSLDYLIKKEVKSFWLPAKRRQPYDPFQWTLPGDDFGETIDFDDYNYEVKDNFKDQCLKMEIMANKVILEAANCDLKLKAFCVYDEDSVIEVLKNKYTSRFRFHQNKNFYLQKFNGNVKDLSVIDKEKLLRINKQYSLNFILSLIKEFKLNDNDRCLINLESDTLNSAYFFNQTTGKFPIIDKKGKWILENYFNCAILVEKRVLRTPEMFLKFDKNSGKLYLSVYSEEYLWKDELDDNGMKCFTISDNELIKEAKVLQKIWSQKVQKYSVQSFNDNLQQTEITKTIYEVKLYGDGPGYYWCEGYSLYNFDLIQTPLIVGHKKLKGVVYSLLMDIKYDTTQVIYKKQFLKNLCKNLKTFLKGYKGLKGYGIDLVDLIKNIRVMKILDIDPIHSKMRAILHMTVSSDDDSSEESMENYYADSNPEEYSEESKQEKKLNYNVKFQFQEFLQDVKNPIYTFISINSTEFCLPVSTTNPALLRFPKLTWPLINVGETIAPNELCLLRNGLPLTRKCVGDFVYGGKWEDLLPEKLKCINKDVLTLHTKRLHSYNKNITQNETTGIIHNMTSISSHFEQLIPADLFYISKTVQQLSNTEQIIDVSDLTDKYKLTLLLNNLMNVNISFVQMSQRSLNTTNILLDSFDNLLNQLATNYSISANLSQFEEVDEDDGTTILITDKIIIFTSDPVKQNVSGLALVRSKGVSKQEESFYDFTVKKIYSNQTIDGLLDEYQDTLEIASFLPQELIDRIDEFNALANVTASLVPLKIVMKIYYNDVMFQENANVTFFKTQSKVISVSLPGHSKNLPIMLPIMFKKSSVDQTEANACGYWEFQPNGSSSSSSEWFKEGCEYIGNSKYDKDLVLCGCTHLTHFAYLVMGTYSHSISVDNEVIITDFDIHDSALDLITLFGGTLSIVGIIGIFVTAFCFRSWREKAGTKVLLQLSLAIGLQMVLLLFINHEKYNYTLDTANEVNRCIFLGASSHYFVLATFSWMLITAFLQFKRYVIVLGNLKPEHFFIKSFVIGWGVPLIPVAILLLVSSKSYIPEIYGICYPHDLALYLGVLLPVGLIIAANLFVFLLVLYTILKSTSLTNSMRKSEKSQTLNQLRVSVFLFFLLGLTWIFGLLVKSNILFSYLFCLTATIQGFVLFIYFIIMDPLTRKFWRESFRSWSTRR